MRALHYSEFGERMRTMWDAGDQGAQDWLSLEPALINVLRAPSLVAAMQKFLGDDYQMAAPWCNRTGQGGMMGYHITGADNVGNDQGFHKDGTGTRRFALDDRCARLPLRSSRARFCTDHGNTQCVDFAQTTATLSQLYVIYAIAKPS